MYELINLHLEFTESVRENVLMESIWKPKSLYYTWRAAYSVTHKNINLQQKLTPSCYYFDDDMLGVLR